MKKSLLKKKLMRKFELAIDEVFAEAERKKKAVVTGRYPFPTRFYNKTEKQITWCRVFYNNLKRISDKYYIELKKDPKKREKLLQQWADQTGYAPASILKDITAIKKYTAVNQKRGKRTPPTER